MYVSRDQAYSRPEWSHALTQDTGWRQAQVSFITHAQLQVIFAAELENGFSGVALDDITISDGKCAPGGECGLTFVFCQYSLWDSFNII